MGQIVIWLLLLLVSFASTTQGLQCASDEDYTAAHEINKEIQAIRAAISKTSCANCGISKPSFHTETYETWYWESCGYCGKQSRLLNAAQTMASLEHRVQSELTRAKKSWPMKFNTAH